MNVEMEYLLPVIAVVGFLFLLAVSFTNDLFGKKTYVVMVSPKEEKDGWLTVHPVSYHTFVARMTSVKEVRAYLKHGYPQYFTDEWVITVKKVERWESANR